MQKQHQSPYQQSASSPVKRPNLGSEPTQLIQKEPPSITLPMNQKLAASRASPSKSEPLSRTAQQMSNSFSPVKANGDFLSLFYNCSF